MLNPSERLAIDQAIHLLESKYKREDLRAFCPVQVRKYCQLNLSHLNYEAFGLLKLDSEGRLIEFKELFRGSIDRASVHPREVLYEVINSEASSVILTHNHPSGNVKPSREDIWITKKLARSLFDIGVKIVDHIIVSKVDTFSFAENNILPNGQLYGGVRKVINETNTISD